MYSWLFNRLPGPLWLKIILSLVIVAAILILLVTVIFPWTAEVTKINESTVGTLVFRIPSL